ncbi:MULTISPECIES: hypothetical protein [unclassified Burkholderia]|uniref:hypothetical protein n=1 Tax=unclassified Burkholderia TaxID=2613784 RepID=UPI001423D47A|nr:MULTISPECIES: hypothetical protein [unclassified Burkholderia]
MNRHRTLLKTAAALPLAATLLDAKPGAGVAAALAALVSLGVLCVDWSRRG